MPMQGISKWRKLDCQRVSLAIFAYASKAVSMLIGGGLSPGLLCISGGFRGCPPDKCICVTNAYLAPILMSIGVPV